MNAAGDKPTASADWYTVEVRQNKERDAEAAQLAGLRVQSIKFAVGERPRIMVDGWYDAAVTGMEAVANGTDWPAGPYLVIVEKRQSSSAYVARLGEHREFSLEKAKAADWAF